jgi:ADP-ribose pyrophosphatase
MELKEQRVSGETVYSGKIVQVTVDKALLPNGRLATREVVRHPGGVAILALDTDNTVTLVRQYRYPIDQLLLELPAGKLDHGAEEDRLLGAQRELSEETGLEAAEWTYLGCILASPGFCDEALHMYLARDLRRAAQHPDEDEFLELVTMPFDTLAEQAMDGTITDAKTVATVLKVKVLLGL